MLEGESRSGTRPSRSNVVWRRISERIEERLVVLETGIGALLNGSMSSGDSASCRAEASLLSDWLFALDLTVAGRLARDIVDSFDGTPELSEAAAIAAVIARLRTIIRVAEDDWANVEPTDVRVHFVSSANAQIDAVAWHLQQSGIDITYSPTFFSVPDDVDLVVLMTEHPDDAQGLLNILRQRSNPVTAAVVYSSDVEVEDLLRVAPSADLFLPYAAPPVEMANQILIALRPAQLEWSEVVLYGADEFFPELIRSGFTGVRAQSAKSVIDMVESGSRVVVLGPDAENRPELVHLLRRSPKTRSAIISATCADSAEQVRCSRAGANLTIPLTGKRKTWAAQLLALTTAQDRASGVVSNDVASLLSGPRAWVVLERAIGEIERGRGKATLATIALPDDLDDEAIDRIHELLADEFRRDDTVVLIDEKRSYHETVVVLLRGAEMDDAVDRIQRAVDKLELPDDPGMVGLASFPEDGLGVKALVREALGVADRAAESGGPSVVRTGWFPGIQARIDVLVIESDPTLSRLLQRLMRKEGYDTEALDTGSAALHALTGPNPIAPPRLLLLELDAMGTDGMMILRSLVRAEVLEQSAVILTCSVTNDAQLREAFELGATDVITKPFSAVVLRNRIERALEW